jgi:hypothetical protein
MTQADDQFEQDVERLLEDSRRIWQTLARDRLLRYAIDGSTREQLPRLAGRVEGIEVELVAVGERYHGYRTEVRARSKHPMRGNVFVSRRTHLGGVLRWHIGRHYFGDPELDGAFRVRATSESLRRAVLDERSVATLRLLVERTLWSFSYRSGEIAITWAGVERDDTLLSEVLDVAAHLAVTGSAQTPYR